MAETKSLIGTQNKKGQTYTDPWKMLNEAPRTPSFFTGSEVIKEAIRRASCDVMIAYPITPQSEAAALIGELFAEGYVGDYFRGESEFAVMSQCAGASFGGARGMGYGQGYRYAHDYDGAYAVQRALRRIGRRGVRAREGGAVAARERNN